MAQWDDISDVLTAVGATKVTVGQVLGFQQEDEIVYYKVMRKTDKGKVWVKKHRLFSPEEVETIAKERQDGKAT